MKLTFWGVRGSVPTPGPDTVKYGGNTCCTSISNGDSIIVLDAGTGIRLLGDAIIGKIKKIYIFLSHLHLDHILGLGFFKPLYEPDVEVHFFGPSHKNYPLSHRMSQYLSPPLFPVLLKDLPCQLDFHELSTSTISIESFSIKTQFVIHPGLTLGYRIMSDNIEIAYLSDHEPLLAYSSFPTETEWVSGFDIAKQVDLLIHDAQYTREEYQERVGWGHSSINNALKFGSIADVKAFVPIHYDPSHNDDFMDKMIKDAYADIQPNFPIYPAKEGMSIEISKKAGKTILKEVT